MPELPDILLYQHSLRAAGSGANDRADSAVRVPSCSRSVEPPIREAEGRKVLGIERVGKRLVFALEEDWFLVLHLMIAGRLKWLDTGAKLPGRIGLAAFDFPTGTLALTEAGSKRRASLHVVIGREALKDFARGGLDVLSSSPAEFAERLRRQKSHTQASPDRSHNLSTESGTPIPMRSCTGLGSLPLC